MKKLFPLIVFFLMAGCSRKIKTYHLNGNIKTECPLDKDGKKDGLFREYDTSGNVLVETEIKHDTLSGVVKDFYPLSGKLYILVHYYPIYYPDTVTPMLLLAQISKYTNVETFVYDKQGHIEEYNIIFMRNKKTLMVKYRNDTISEIWGDPYIPIRTDLKNENTLQTLSLKIGNIPKYKTNAWVLDSSDVAVDSCKDCKELNTRLSLNNPYTLQIEYVDSVFNIEYIKKIPITNPNKVKFPHAREVDWKREYQ
jgi:hypothetical protein